MDSVQMSSEKLILFDYSGTLSLEAPRFARPENLVRVFRETGLASLGVATPELFWEQIVGPTWVEGSTTQAGYRKVMTERIAALRLTSGTTPAQIEAAAGRFVAAYLGQSRIDPLWSPLLGRLNTESAALTVIATDHYAEATAAIVAHLRDLSIPAMPVRQGHGHGDSGFLVANSADLGAWKADRRFWEMVKAQLPCRSFRELLLVDDFGRNEEAGDTYGQREKVMTRQKGAVEVLQEAFRAEVDLFPFFLEDDSQDPDADRARLITAATSRVEYFLN